MRTKSLTLVGIGLFALGCVRPARERAERDRDVGKASSSALDVKVAHGLAAVRTLEPGRLVLWSSAPGWELELDAQASSGLTLEVQNCLPDVELTSLEPSARVTALTSEPSTRKRFELELPAGTSRFRLAAPDADQRGAFEFALMSDVQEAIERVRDIYRRVNEEPDVRFLLGAGDLTRRGTEAELGRFRDELEELGVPYYTTLGNHELGTSPPPYQDWYGRANFQFVFRGVYFTMLDSASATLDPLVYDWLDTWLARGRSSVHVVAMHIPPLDPTGVRNGAFASRGEAAALLAELAENHVDLTLYGHIHSYYRFENAGIPAFISGGGGAIPERFDDMGRHFMVIDIDADRGVVGTRVVRVYPEDVDD
jgi:Icc-related predicted phosphoesterase